jgi:hypothetical protein
MQAPSCRTLAVRNYARDEKTKGNSVDNFDRDRHSGDEPADLDSDRLQVGYILHGICPHNWILDRIGSVVSII